MSRRRYIVYWKSFSCWMPCNEIRPPWSYIGYWKAF